jgi:predicted nuclease with TOPRIM domain
MTDRLADIKAALDRGEVNYRGEHDDLRWLVAEVERLQPPQGTARIWAVKYEEAAAELTTLRQQTADMERGVADALNGAIGEQDMGVVAGVELLAERYAALRQLRDGDTLAFQHALAEKDGAYDVLLAHANEVERENAALREQVSRGQDAVNTLNDRLATLRQRHAEAVKACWHEAWSMGWQRCNATELNNNFDFPDDDAAWLASEAKKGLT